MDADIGHIQKDSRWHRSIPVLLILSATILAIFVLLGQSLIGGVRTEKLIVDAGWERLCFKAAEKFNTARQSNFDSGAWKKSIGDDVEVVMPARTDRQRFAKGRILKDRCSGQMSQVYPHLEEGDLLRTGTSGTGADLVLYAQLVIGFSIIDFDKVEVVDREIYVRHFVGRDIVAYRKSLLFSLAGGLIAGLVFAAALALFFGKRVQTALLYFTETLEQFARGNRARRIDVAIQPTAEFEDLAINVNGLLDRLNHQIAALDVGNKMVLHDIRSPIGLARRWLQNDGDNIETRERIAAKLLDAITHADEVLKALSLGDVSGDPIDFAALIAERLDLTRANLEERGLQVTFTITDPICIYGERSTVTTILDNVIGNMLAHAAPGIAEVNVSVTRDRFQLTFQNETNNQSHETGVAHHGIGLTTIETLAQRLGWNCQFVQNSGFFVSIISGPSIKFIN